MSADQHQLTRTMSRQLGLVTREQAVRAGLSSKAIEHRRRAGEWMTVRRGVYRSAAAPVTWYQRALAACIGRGAAVALSHCSAAYVHGLVREPPRLLDAVVRRGASGTGLRGLAVVHYREADAVEWKVVHGIPVTGLAITIADLACAGGVPLGDVVNDALFGCANGEPRAALLRRLSALAATARPGTPALRSALRPWTSDEPARRLQSALEAKVLRLLLDARLPAPHCQHEVLLPTGGVASIDLAWPAQRVALEVDGFRFHADRAAFDYDRIRGNELVGEGWQLLRTTASQVRTRPDELIRTVNAALGRAGRPSPQPPA